VTGPSSNPRPRVDQLTDDMLDQLYAELWHLRLAQEGAGLALQAAVRKAEEQRQRAEKAEAERDELLAELAGRDEEARERWIQKQLDETGIKAMDFRNGMSMEIEPARELVAHWVGAARAMLGDAPNYTETPIEMEVKVGESPERFIFVLQRAGKLTPHQARQQAEERAEKAERELGALKRAHVALAEQASRNQAALRRARGLHQDDGGQCTACAPGNIWGVTFPCATRTALDAATTETS